jgi:hypothetical protein
VTREQDPLLIRAVLWLVRWLMARLSLDSGSLFCKESPTSKECTTHLLMSFTPLFLKPHRLNSREERTTYVTPVRRRIPCVLAPCVVLEVSTACGCTQVTDSLSACMTIVHSRTPLCSLSRQNTTRAGISFRRHRTCMTRHRHDGALQDLHAPLVT